MIATALCGAKLITPEGVLEDHALVVTGDRIAAIVPVSQLPVSDHREDLEGGFLAPGFIDVQVNGGGGVLLNDHPNVEGMEAIALAHRRFGTTGLMPTLISDDLQVVAQALDAADAAVSAGVPGVLGVHIEGPFLNPGKKGIHDDGKFRVLGEAAMALFTRRGPARRMLTLAPELAPPGAIKALTDAGVIVCAGHSLADYDQSVVALKEGLAGFTHLFNAMTQLGSREPGMVGAALEDRRSRFGLIVDGDHVHPASLRIALAARGVEGAMLVTDAMPTVGAPTNSFMLGDRPITAVGSACYAADGTLAGSNLDMATAFRNAIRLLGVTPAVASSMASGNPAGFLGLAHERGALAPGLLADLIHLDEAFALKRVWIAGA
jgi:N-acetylglucosamine-6-phosphate deacetylase